VGGPPAERGGGLPADRNSPGIVTVIVRVCERRFGVEPAASSELGAFVGDIGGG
jgi:hypothetical protein